VPLLRAHHHVLSATKGLADDGRRMSEVWAEAVGASRVAVLSGPNISREIAAGHPAATVIASVEAGTAKRFQALTGTPMFRSYTDADVIGVELCGAAEEHRRARCRRDRRHGLWRQCEGGVHDARAR
jgi:glycerol-3-phosphate dehydrogenase (NAD(P)+)